jgi:alpha-L-fucosidase 2
LPVNHLRPGLPPFLLLHGATGQSVPYEQSLTFQSTLRANGVRSVLALAGSFSLEG